MVTTYTEHTRSRNMETTFKGNPKTIDNPFCNDYYQLLEEPLKLKFPPVVLVTTYNTEHTRSRNVEATFIGNHQTLAYPSLIGYYIY